MIEFFHTQLDSRKDVTIHFKSGKTVTVNKLLDADYSEELYTVQSKEYQRYVFFFEDVEFLEA